MKRRALLVAASLSLSTAVAGCLGGDDETDDSGNGENEDDENGTDDNGTGENGNGENGGENGENGADDYADEAGDVPSDLLAEYYEALLSADVDATNDLLHSELSGEAREVHFQGDSGFELTAIDVAVAAEHVDSRELNVEPIPEDETTVLAVAAATVAEPDGTENTVEGEFVLVTENGQWRLWDLVGGWFRYAPAYLEITRITGIVGSEGEIHELRVGVQSATDSEWSDLTALRLTYIPQQGSADQEAGAPATVQTPRDVTSETNPEDVEPQVVEVDGRPADRFGVSVVSADNPDDLRLAPGDEYELVIDTSGDDAHEDLPGLTPLRSGNELMLQMDSIFMVLDTYEASIPDLDGLDAGEEVDI